jgi:para-aminobenzoate synthetase / 4-amino-4-deoxychorismate lyase
MSAWLPGLGVLGRLLASSEVSPADWLMELASRHPIVLAPDSASGWFGGAALVAFDPLDGGFISDSEPDEVMRIVGRILESVLDAEKPALAVVQLPYSGPARWARYERGVARDAHGWRAWGSEPSDGWPEPPVPGCLRSGSDPGPLAHEVASSLTAPAWCAAVDAAQEAIRDGAVYVVNLTRIIGARVNYEAPMAFSHLLEHAPSSMAAAWLHEAGCGILSVSPERFLRLDGCEVEIAPVKGTRRRGITHEEDTALATELSSSEKERAEHVMVVDMERNDLGRVCVPGTVCVDPLLSIETTAYAHQMVSRVRGLLRPEADIAELLGATFPCGSVTGAPKLAAMRVLGELEPSQRGSYTGSLLVAVPGQLDSSVLIRTLELDGDVARYGTGCGITIDSDPIAEWEETVLKANPVLAGSSRSAGAPPVALKETCRVVGGLVPLWGFHRARLAAGGCSRELLALAEARAFEAAAAWADAATRRARLTVVVSPDGSVTAEVSRRLSSLDVPRGPVVARVDVDAMPELPPGPAKPADRSVYDAAGRRAQGLGAQQAVLVGPDGYVIDGSSATVWIAENGALVTPPSPPAVPGVGRAFVLATAEAVGLRVRVEPVSWERFASAEEAFLTNAYGGAVPVRGRGGEIGRAVRELFDSAWASSETVGALPRAGSPRSE